MKSLFTKNANQYKVFTAYTDKCVVFRKEAEYLMKF